MASPQADKVAEDPQWLMVMTNHSLMKKIVEEISVKDSCRLACTCSKLRDVIEKVFDCLCKKLQISSHVERFYSYYNAVRAGDSATINEKEVFDSGKYTSTWLYSIGYKKRGCIRQAACAVRFFPHIENEKYIVPVADKVLGRKIVKLRTVSWLEVSHEFGNVTPGWYTCSVRVRVSSHVNIDEPGVTLRVDWKCNGEPHSKKKLITPEDWIGLRKTYQNEWFDEVLDSFHVLGTSDIGFYFGNIDGPGWQQGLCWDYIELKQELKQEK